MHDIDAAKSAVRIEEVIGRTVKLARRGREWLGLCPFHEEKTPSFTVYGDRWHCFGCGAKGDVLDFIRETRRCSLPEALSYLGADAGTRGSENKSVEYKPAEYKPPEYKSFLPPDNAPLPPLPTDKKSWTYRDATGRPVSYVIRTDKPDGSKIFAGLSWGGVGDDVPSWKWKHPSAPRPLYGLEKLAACPDKPVVICEGEKAADAAQELLPDFVAVCWPGGATGVGKTDWRPLEGRDLTIWPDADEPGARAAEQIREIFPAVAILDTTGLAKGFDAADLRVDDPVRWFHDRVKGSETQRDELLPPLEEVEAPLDMPAPPDDYQQEPETPDIRVIPLGYDRERFYYFSTHKRMVIDLTAGEHTRSNLSGMASAANYWEREFPLFISKQGISWPQLADHLMDLCRNRGVYDPAIIRGRGAWMEGETPVLHVGDSLIVHGERRGLRYPGSRFIYEADISLLQDIAAPLSTHEAHWLAKVCKLLRWETPVHGTLLAGWIVLAPVCGALQWRPSIWISGASGAGKSWVMDRIVNMCLAKVGLYVAFNTTEPGIRQALQSDARPVIFDEAERDSAQAAFRMDEILGYQRVASSENSVQILKGDTSGARAKSYKPRSCFLFQSINTGITKRSDESRVTVLALRDYSLEGDITFDDLEVTTRERITPEFAAGLITRTVNLLPVIRANAVVFARAVAAHLKSRRFGDQIGALLAGAYSLHSAELITYEKALEVVRREEWSEQAPQEDERDEFKLLRLILAARVKINASEAPVSRLIEAATASFQIEGLPDSDLAKRIVSEHGIRIGHHENRLGLFFSTNHPALKRILRGTEWEAAWSRSLGRVPGSVAGREVGIVRFGLGHQSRATFIPMSVIDPS